MKSRPFTPLLWTVLPVLIIYFGLIGRSGVGAMAMQNPTPEPTVDITLKTQADRLKTEGNELAVSNPQAALGKYQQALQLYRQALDRDGQARVLYNIGLVYATQSTASHPDYPQAIDHLHQALTIWRKLDDTEWQTKALVNIGMVYEAMGDPQQVVAHYQQALTLLHADKNQAGEALIRMGVASNLHAIGKDTEALDHYTVALMLWRIVGDQGQEVLTLKAIALIQQSLGNYQAALEYYQQALELWQVLGNQAEAAIAHRFIGDIWQNLGDYRRTLAEYAQALTFWQTTDVPERDDEAQHAAELLNVIGDLYLSLGDYAQAEAYNGQARTVWQALNDGAGQAKSLRQLGFIASMLGNYTAALRYYQQALDLWRSLGDRSGEAAVLTDMGFTYDWQGDPHRSVDALIQALTLWQAEKSEFQLIRVLSKLAFVYAELYVKQELSANERPQLQVYLTQALTQINSLKQPDYKAILLARSGLAYTLLGEKQKSIAAYNQALALAEELGDPLQQVTVLDSIGLTYEFTNSAEQAIQLYKKAIDLLETIQGNLKIEELKTTFAADPKQTNIYHRLIHLFVQAGRAEEAFAYVERARARTFLDQLGNQPIDFRQGAAPASIAQEQILRQQIISLQQALNAERVKPFNPQNQTALQKIGIDLAQARQEYGQQLIRLKATNPEYADLVTVDTLTLRQVQTSVVPSGVTLIEYFVMADETLVWVIDRQRTKLIRLDLPEKTINRQVAFAHKLLTDPTHADDLDSQTNALAKLYDELFSPLAPYIQQANLLIVPHGALHYLPFAALWDTKSERYLVQKYTLTYAPSASTLRFIQQKRNPNAQRLLTLGNPDGSLPNATTEVKAIAQLYQAQPLLAQAATESQLYAQAAQADIVHLAAHGVYDRFNPLFTRIELAADASNDGNLEVHEIFGLNLKNSNLVVLSACETALGEQSRGDEITGLTRAFLYAGTPSIVATLWRIDDAAASELMVVFYKELRSGKSVTTALRLAQLVVLVQRKWQSPSYWAAFTLHGDGEQILTAAPTR